MPHNAKGDHYANPAYGRMMEGGESKGKMSMEAYGEKAAAYMKAGYMINKLEIEYAENGFVVKCHWEYPKGDMKKMKNGEMGMASMGYMEPTVKVFENVKDMTAFVSYAFNAYRHGGKEMKSSHGSHGYGMGKVSSPRTAIASASVGKGYPGENGTKPKAPLRNTNKGVKGRKGNPHY